MTEKANNRKVCVRWAYSGMQSGWMDISDGFKASEIRFLRGRLKFGDARNSAPFPSMVVVFRNQ